MPPSAPARAKGSKQVYYLSLEFLIGRLLAECCAISASTKSIVRRSGTSASTSIDCDLPSPTRRSVTAASDGLPPASWKAWRRSGIPAYGYGIRYDHGLFRQVIRNGWQQEYPEEWLLVRQPWEFARPEVMYDIYFGGLVESDKASKRAGRSVWRPDETIVAVAYDTPIVGWRGRHVNPLRLWSARAVDPVRLDSFNSGDHIGALVEQTRAEAISKILYPSDDTPRGPRTAATAGILLRVSVVARSVHRHLRTDGICISCRCGRRSNSMTLIPASPSPNSCDCSSMSMGCHGVTLGPLRSRTFSYTNHTLLPEALETWPMELFERVLPRHLQIIYRINAEHLEDAKQQDPVVVSEGLSSISLIDERDGRKLRMGHLAFVGSHRINGVSALHTELMRKTVFRDLNALYPDRIVNKTNGITFRRWLMQANPALMAVLREVCGDAVLDDPALIQRLAAGASDKALHERVAAAKRANKVALSRLVGDQLDLRLDPDALFDVHIKRIHEYKRQLLNILETVALYRGLREDPNRDFVPRVKIFAGKAAASYATAKLIIKLINDVARVINSDPVTRDLLQVVFLPDYNVSLAEAIIPAADLSEQISTAGMEASGTGNMKLALNGALTIGTLDGANIEIREHVGADNIFIFGLNAQEVEERRRHDMTASAALASSPDLAHAIEAVEAGVYWPGEEGLFAPLMSGLRHNDYYMVTADFDDYCATQRRVEMLWRSQFDWTRTSVMNIAHMAWFSSDRAIGEYARDIWEVPFTMPADAIPAFKSLVNFDGSNPL